MRTGGPMEGSDFAGVNTGGGAVAGRAMSSSERDEEEQLPIFVARGASFFLAVLNASPITPGSRVVLAGPRNLRGPFALCRSLPASFALFEFTQDALYGTVT